MHTDSTPKGDLVKLQRGLMTEADARAMLERIRWPKGVACLYCGSMNIGRIEAKGKVYTRPDGSERVVPARHLYKCRDCRKQFSVTKGTIFEDSKISLQVWITVMYRMCSSKKGISAYQIHREYGMNYEAAWFMCHRIRWAMTEKGFSFLSGTVEADETYVGGKPRGNRKGIQERRTRSEVIKEAVDKKTPVFGILERGGRVRAGVMPKVTGPAAQGALLANLDLKNTRLMTDEAQVYKLIGKHLPHDVIRHKSEYVRGEVHTQGIEGFWAGLKRQLIGTHHHVDAGYLNMYVQESAFRHNTRKQSDAERFAILGGQVDGRVDWYLGRNAKDADLS